MTGSGSGSWGSPATQHGSCSFEMDENKNMPSKCLKMENNITDIPIIIKGTGCPKASGEM